jgi:hypothetical protein
MARKSGSKAGGVKKIQGGVPGIKSKAPHNVKPKPSKMMKGVGPTR